MEIHWDNVINCANSAAWWIRYKHKTSNHLGEILNLAVYPKPKKTKKGYAKAKQEHWLNTKQDTYFCNFNCSIVEGTLVRVLIDLINNSPNKIIRTRL